MSITYCDFNDSQLPVLQLLQKRDWEYISSKDSLLVKDSF